MSWRTELDDVLRAAHARLARDPEAQSFQVDLVTAGQREAFADFLGISVRPNVRTKVPIVGPRGLGVAVEEATGRPLVEFLVDEYGPLIHPGEERRRAELERQALWDWWLGHPFFDRCSELHAWAQDIKRRGVRGGVSATRELLETALVVLAELPAADEPLPVFAGRLLNDTHALDANTALATHVLGAIAAAQGIPKPTDTASRRELWHSVGVRDDELSSIVLIAGFRPSGSSTTAQLCRLAGASGEALALTLGQVRQPGTDWCAERVFVVENPAILALAVHEFGANIPPMVCGSGWPSSAVTELLEQLASGGTETWYHGDFDGEGIRIADHLVSSVGARPWRMTASDYLEDVADQGASVGQVSAASWDAELAPALRERGIAVLEETVWQRLRDDLEREVRLAVT